MIKVAYLREGCPDLEALKTILQRTVDAIGLKAAKLGLTRQGRSHRLTTRRRQSETVRLQYAMGRAHPRGMSGKRHSVEARAKMRESAKRNVANGTHPGMGPRSVQQREALSRLMTARLKESDNIYSRCKRGRREDLGGKFFRSAWEANYARYLNLLQRTGQIVRWAYESTTFWFEAIRRGVRSYTPDFEVQPVEGASYYVEVKGWMDAKSRYWYSLK